MMMTHAPFGGANDNTHVRRRRDASAERADDVLLVARYSRHIDHATGRAGSRVPVIRAAANTIMRMPTAMPFQSATPLPA